MLQVRALSQVTVCGLLLSMAGLPVSATANEPKDAQQVMASLTAMAQATINRDVGALGAIYHDDLTYTHSSGSTQTKAEVLKAAVGRTVVKSMTFTDTVVRIYGAVALAKGMTHIVADVAGNTVDAYLNVLWVLVKGRQGWQIVARQPIQVPAPAREAAKDGD